MLKIYITRHGETQWNRERRLQGRKDSNLTDLGQNQAKKLSKRLKDIKFNAVYSSSSERTLQTAKLICNKKEASIIPCEELMEIALGKWEGMSIEEIDKQYKEDFDHFWNFPHLYNRVEGETFFDAQKRVVNFLHTLTDKHQDESILIVTHGVIVKLLMAYVQEIKMEHLWEGPRIEQTSLSILNHHNDGFILELYGDTSHYEIED